MAVNTLYVAIPLLFVLPALAAEEADAACSLQTRAAHQEADKVWPSYCADVELNYCELYRDQGLCATEMVAWACMNTCASCGRCRDLDSAPLCKFYKHRGQCSHHLKTRVYCRKTCRLCNDPSEFPVPAPAPPPPCVDRDYSNCAGYKSEGGCAISENVRSWCKKTCGLCPGQCIDLDHQNCEGYMRQGGCDTNANVQAYCQKTCGLCTAVLPIPQPEPAIPTCADRDPNNCVGYLREGGCTSNQNVRSWCQRTCGLCPGQCIDLDTTNCEAYKAVGGCNTNDNVRAYCRMTCGLCDMGTLRPLTPLALPSSSGKA
jgi:hypothetical protein